MLNVFIDEIYVVVLPGLFILNFLAFFAIGLCSNK